MTWNDVNRAGAPLGEGTNRVDRNYCNGNAKSRTKKCRTNYKQPIVKDRKKNESH